MPRDGGGEKGARPGDGRPRPGTRPSSPRAPDRGMGRVDEVLDGVLESLGIREDVARQAALARWATCVGPGIARVTRPRVVARGVLFVDVRSSAWLNELNLMRHDLLARLNAGAGEARVERIVFSLAGDPAFEEDPSGADSPGRPHRGDGA